MPRRSRPAAAAVGMRSEVASGIIGMGGADGGVAPPPVVTGGMVVGTWPAEAASGRLGGNEVGAPPVLAEAGMPALVLVGPRELPPPAGGRLAGMRLPAFSWAWWFQ